MLTNRISVERWVNDHPYNPRYNAMIHLLFSQSLSFNDVYNYRTKSSQSQFINYLNCIASCVMDHRESDGQILSTLSCTCDECKKLISELPINNADLGQHFMKLGFNVVWDDSFQSEDYNHEVDKSLTVENLQTALDDSTACIGVKESTTCNQADSNTSIGADECNQPSVGLADNGSNTDDTSLDISNRCDNNVEFDTIQLHEASLTTSQVEDTTSYEYIQANHGRLSNLKHDNVESFRADYRACTIDGYGRHRVNFDKVWHSGTYEGEKYIIGTSLPEIPELQCDISITTNVDRMTEADLLHLYPTRELKEFRHHMVDRFEGCPVSKYVSSYLPIPGYTDWQLIENIIKYPFPQEYRRYINDQFVEVWKHVEIDGELVDIVKAFDQSQLYGKVQRCRRVLQEYGYRKAMLDLEYNKEVKYPLIGDIQPYLALVFPEYVYKDLGYDTVELARKSVISRVALLRSVNPVIRRIGLPCKNV